MMQSPNSICQHGSQRRKCLICEYEADIKGLLSIIRANIRQMSETASCISEHEHCDNALINTEADLRMAVDYTRQAINDLGLDLDCEQEDVAA